MRKVLFLALFILGNFLYGSQLQKLKAGDVKSCNANNWQVILVDDSDELLFVGLSECLSSGEEQAWRVQLSKQKWKKVTRTVLDTGAEVAKLLPSIIGFIIESAQK